MLATAADPTTILAMRRDLIIEMQEAMTVDGQIAADHERRVMGSARVYAMALDVYGKRREVLFASLLAEARAVNAQFLSDLE